MTAELPGLAVYIHWPYCASKCPYCDFNSHAARAGVDEARFARAIVRELAHWAGVAPGRTITSVFFGGGTPSLMSAATVDAILDQIAALWPLAADIEVSLESNPSSADAGRFAGYRAAGVNRLSLGVQSLRDDALRFLGRVHDADEARAAVALAQRHFERVSFDLIYARLGQSEADWRVELGEALALGCAHLSAYQLTIEPGTAFFRLHQAGKLAAAPEERALALYEITQELTDAAGLPAYEISNHARPGEECRHNLTYWRSGDYLGVGPGAHGRLSLGGKRLAIAAERDPAAWLAAVERDGIGTAETAELSKAEQAEEMLLMGLRLAEGVELGEIGRRTGLGLAGDAVTAMIAAGLLHHAPGSEPGNGDGEAQEVITSGWLRASRPGRLVLNRLVLELAEALEIAQETAPMPRAKPLGTLHIDPIHDLR